ncbi:MAG TPA: hypothetical protein VGI66_13840 [Streptosporangiaceae bacterium]|jgi:hypothetical protein
MSAQTVPLMPGSGAESAGLTRLRSVAVALIMAGYLTAALVITARLWAGPGSQMVAGNPNDNDYYAWMLRYSAAAISHGRLPALVTAALDAPHGINLMWNNSMLAPGVLLTPVTDLFGPQASLTVLLTLGFAGSAASMLFVLRRWGISLPAAALGGAVYGFSPALLHSAIGHYNLQFAVLPPLIVDVGLRLCLGRARPVRAGALLGVLVTVQLFIAAEVLLDVAMAAVVLVIVLAAGRPRAVAAHFRPAVTGLAVAALTTLLLAGRALWVQFSGPLTEHGSAFLFDFYKNDLSAFITPSGLLLFHTTASAAAASRYQGGPPEYLAYLGVPLIAALAIAIVALWRELPVRAVGLTLAVLELLSLGAHPLVSGTVQTGVTLPWAWLGHLPVVSSVLPARISVVADGAAAALLAFALDAARSRLARRPLMGYAVSGIAVLALLPLIPLPLPAQPVAALPAGWASAFTALRLPAGASVLVVPVPTATVTYAERWQAQSGEQISLNAGYFQGPASDGQAYVEGNGLPPLAYYLDQLWTGTGSAPPPSAAEARATLANWDPAAVVAVTGSRSPTGRYLIGLLGPPAVAVGSVLAWREAAAG